MLSFARDFLPFPDHGGEMQKPKDKAATTQRHVGRVQLVENDLVATPQEPKQRDGDRCDFTQASRWQITPLEDCQVSKNQQGERHMDFNVGGRTSPGFVLATFNSTGTIAGK